VQGSTDMSNFVQIIGSGQTHGCAASNPKTCGEKSASAFFADFEGALSGIEKENLPKQEGPISFESVDISDFLKFLGINPEEISSLLNNNSAKTETGGDADMPSILSILNISGVPQSELLAITGAEKSPAGDKPEEMSLGRLRQLLSVVADILSGNFSGTGENAEVSDKLFDMVSNPKFLSNLMNLVSEITRDKDIDPQMMAKLEKIISTSAENSPQLPDIKISDLKLAANKNQNDQSAHNRPAINMKNIDKNSEFEKIADLMVKNLNGKNTEGRTIAPDKIMSQLQGFEGAGIKIFTGKKAGQSGKTGLAAEESIISKLEDKLSQKGESPAFMAGGDLAGKEKDNKKSGEFKLIDMAGNLLKTITRSNGGKTEKAENMPKTQILRNIKLAEIARTINNIVKSAPANSTSTARLILKPESLGTVFVEISMNGNMAKLNIKADSREAVKSIESQIAALRDKLSQNGIKTESVDIGERSAEGYADSEGRRRQYSKSYKDDRRMRREFVSSFAADMEANEEEALSRQH
jgi:hypothetical protein